MSDLVFSCWEALLEDPSQISGFVQKLPFYVGQQLSLFQTAMFNGDVNLSCTMTFISTLGSFAFTSLWAFLLGSPLIGKNISIPYTGIASSLASFTLPLFLGMLFKVGFFPSHVYL